ncbi:MAG: hypothetical protein AB2L14_15825 [Candidatus Xenobiia bacterium LiM19]
MALSANTLLSSGYNEIAADEKQVTDIVDDTLTHGLSGPEVPRHHFLLRHQISLRHHFPVRYRFPLSPVTQLSVPRD